MWTNHTHCRACGYAEQTGPPGIKATPPGEMLSEVFDLGLQPPANDFKSETEEHEGWAPLKVLMCPRCQLAQLSVTVNPSSLYSQYSYVTSGSETMLRHFDSLWRCIKDRQTHHANVIEIGSNDGAMLSYLKQNGAESVLGIDPAVNLAETARGLGVQSICGLFDKDTAEMASRTMPLVDVVIARHVFCHIDDWRGFVRNLDTICSKDTLVVIEVPYVMDLLRQVQFDTIYHEHLSYLNIRAVEALLAHTSFKMDHIQHFPIHGGAIAIYIRRRDFNGPADDSVEWYVREELKRLNDEAWREFSITATNNINALREKVNGLMSSGNTVCGFGASAKSTVWINACGFTKNQIRFICDNTPQKQWKLSPGSDIPITDEGALLRDRPDYAVLHCWNFLDEVVRRNQSYLKNGGSFIVPVPSLRLIDYAAWEKEKK